MKLWLVVVEADAFVLAILVLSEDWTWFALGRLARLAVAAAANNDGSRPT